MPFKQLSGLAIVATTLIAGCASSGHDDSPAAAPAANAVVANDGRCHAEAAQFAVGQAGSPSLLDQARQQSGSQVARVLRPTDMIPMDYRSDRLSLYVDETGKVTRASCG
ncbi:I78 family peptidase inhibitor [Pseudomonas typographi]|uniref:Peptidase inhibitor I78 family protein n=1 Tax=Pseudomonas typographi TaxID=2715964 RepID=A0ABR7Z7C6_9PSED|nr:I78 family peptidase inhibitor [Pseudomonas typographi]MBD1553828.1 hypothetical protein [Pseudomonas typographi]MBD1588522.1 hypothetical protein [Pseudomonas typographi]MBD1601224.1 hypothetical protein [Pseudomonas typographi]